MVIGGGAADFSNERFMIRTETGYLMTNENVIRSNRNAFRYAGNFTRNSTMFHVYEYV